VGIYFIQETRVIYVVHFEFRRLLLQHKDVFKLLKVVKVLDSDFVFFLIDDPLRWEVAFDDVFETAIVSE
jgi:hypothetical protein